MKDETEGIEGFRRKLEKEIKTGLVTLLVLWIINDSKEPIYGYKIISDLKKNTDGKLVLKEGSVYPILHYLQDQEFVISYLDESPTGAPRKYYRITRRGTKALDAGLSTWKDFSDILDTVFVWEMEDDG